MTTKECSSPMHIGERNTPITEFHKRRASKDGLHARCKACCKKDNRASREQAALIQGKELAPPRVYRERGTAPTYHRPTDVIMKMKQQLRSVRVRCKRDNIPFEITIDNLLPLPTHCPDLGLELQYFSEKGHVPERATIDKIIPALGYIPGNVRIVSHQANVMKQDATLEQLKHIAQKWLLLAEQYDH